MDFVSEENAAGSENEYGDEPEQAPQPTNTGRTTRTQRQPQERPRPGRLSGEAKLTVETREGVAIVVGRQQTDEKPAVLGLYSFAGRLLDVWRAAADDDPYADWFLWQIHELMKAEREKLNEAEKYLDELMAGVRGITFKDGHSVDPVDLDLSFKSPIGFQGAYLVAAYDNVVRKALNAQHVGLLTQGQARGAIVHARGRRLRHLFQIPTHWKFIGVNRDDIRMSTQMGRRAQDLMGELPQEFLDASVRSPHAPYIKQRGRVEQGEALSEAEQGEPSEVVEAA